MEQPRHQADGDQRGEADRNESRARADGTLPAPPTADRDRAPALLARMGGKAWWAVVRATVRQTKDDKLTTWAAALTYYGILSLFPGLLVLISVLRLAGESAVQKVLDNITSTAPGPARSVLTTAVTNLREGERSTAGLVAFIGLLLALWSASGYVGAFMQAANSIFDVPEGRPVWKKLPIRLAITIGAGTVVALAALSVVFTGGLARHVGEIFGLGSSVVTIWDIAKWPVLLLLISLLFAVLYWAAPNARHEGFRWITPGSLLATLIWVAASAGFAFYVSSFSSYDKTYGSLAGVIVFLVWLWISNLAILLGAEFDAEMQRHRAIAAGHRADEEPYMRLRDERTVDAGGRDDL